MRTALRMLARVVVSVLLLWALNWPLGIWHGVVFIACLQCLIDLRTPRPQGEEKAK